MVCFRKGGFAAVTDANLVLGRILPEFFPKIFGQTEDQPLDEHAAHRALQELTDDINQHAEPSQGQKSVDEVRLIMPWTGSSVSLLSLYQWIATRTPDTGSC